MPNAPSKSDISKIALIQENLQITNEHHRAYVLKRHLLLPSKNYFAFSRRLILTEVFLFGKFEKTPREGVFDGRFRFL
jgi:hypothetical protein